MRRLLTIAVLLGAFTGSVQAQSEVPQGGAYADGIRATLAGIDLPEGARIDLYALVPDARHMAVGADGTVYVGTRIDTVWAVTDTTGDHRGDLVRRVAPARDLTMPNGVCLSPEGTLFVAEQNRVLAFPDIAATRDRPDPPAVEVVAQGRLIPPARESANHSARVCRIGPDGKLYVSLGQPRNVARPDEIAPNRAAGIGGIIRMAQDGTGREVVATGIRNSVGMDFDPDTGDLWFTDNQVDRMGDDIPPGEINHLTAPGQDFGFPWFGGGHVRTTEYRGVTPPAGLVFPVVEMQAHAADLGMIFYTGAMFPDYRGAIFSAQHGSWNRSVPVGAQVMMTTFGADGTATARPFASGWIDGQGRYLGRPVDVAQLPDGSLLVSDDLAGALYRISAE